MKAMQDYTYYCTDKQTKELFNLGAPILTTLNSQENGVELAEIYPYHYLKPITTQQAINWLREQGIINIFVKRLLDSNRFYGIIETIVEFSPIQDFTEYQNAPLYAELAAIDLAIYHLKMRTKQK